MMDMATPISDRLSVFCAQPHLKGRYKRLILVSHPRHLERLDLSDDESLIVSTDWLVWQGCLETGAHCIHFEAMLGDWEKERGAWDDLYLDSGRWVYLDGEDTTLFKGVSIGKQFVREVGLAWHAYERMRFALDKLCHRFSPEEIIVFDYRADFDLVDDDLKKHLVESVAADHGAKVTFQLDPTPPEDPALPDTPSYGRDIAETGLRPVLRRLYAKAVEALLSLRWFAGGRQPKVLLIPSHLMWKGMMAGFEGRRLAPVLLAEYQHKNPAFIAACLKKGILLTALPEARLTAGEKAEIGACITRLEAAWRASGDANQMFFCAYVRARLFDSGRFEDMARQIKRYTRLFSRHRFARVMVSDCCAPYPRISLEAANHQGIPCDELLNGMFLTNQKYEARCGDGTSPALIARMLSWGQQNDDWSRNTGSKAATVRTGYPTLDPLHATPKSGPIPATNKGRNMLVLAYPPAGDDVFSIRANCYTFLVETVAALRDMGYRNIRIKLHPGVDRKNYYERILDKFGFDCQVHKESPLNEHLEWADIVIGPVTSGAMLEALAMGKDYLPVWLKPSSIDTSYLDGLPISSTAADICAMLDNGRTIDRAGILEYFCATDDIPNASRRFWDVMEESVCQDRAVK